MSMNSKTAEEILSGSNVMSFTNMAARAGAFPIDKWSIFGALSAAEAYVRQESSIPGYGDATGLPYEGQIIAVKEGDVQNVYVVDNAMDNGLRKLASGGDADEVLRALNQEIERAKGIESTLSTDLGTVSADLNALEGAVDELSNTTIPELESSLSVTVEVQDTAETGFLKTYVVKQGGTQVGAKINIPNDFLVKKAEVKSCEVENLPIEGLKVGDKYIDFTINSKEGEAGEDHLYVSLKDLTDVYTGGTTDTVTVTVGDGNVITAAVNDSSITTAKIADSAVTTAKIDDAAVTTAKVADDAITNDKIADNAVATEQLSAAAVTTAKIADLAVTSDKIADNAITTGKIADGAVETNDLADSAVTHAKLASDAVESANIKDGAVVESKIGEKAVTNSKIGDEAVDTAQIKGGAVTTEKIAAAAVTTAKLEDGAVTTAKIADGNVTLAKIGSDVSAYIEKTASDEADAAEGAAKAYADEQVSALSSELKGDISTARTDLSNYVDAKFEEAQGASEEAIAALSAELKKDVSDEAKARDDADKALSAELKGDVKTEKERAEGIEASLRADLNTVSGDLDTLEGQFSTLTGTTLPLSVSNLENADAYLSSKIENKIKVGEYGKALANQDELSVIKIAAEDYYKLVSEEKLNPDVVYVVSSDNVNAYDQRVINVATPTLSSDATNKAYVDDAIASSESGLTAEVARAKAAEEALDDRIDELSGSFKTISADHEGRIEEVEGKVAKLSSAMHFIGMSVTDLSTGSTVVPVPPYKEGDTPENGDVVINLTDSREFVWASGQWNELGAEGVWATKVALEAEADRAKAAEKQLSVDLVAEADRAKAAEKSVADDISALSGKYEVFTGTTYVADKAALKADDAFISAAVDNKVKVGTYGSELVKQSELSIVKIADDDYYKLVADDKLNPDVVYVVSADNVNAHGEAVINVATPTLSSDATNKAYVDDEIGKVKEEIVSNALSGVQLNGLNFNVANNVASLTIDIINCGGAR